MKKTNEFILAVFAGISIGIGGVVFLATENILVGAVFFTVGLFTVVTNGFYLFTGKVGYALENKPSYIITLFITCVGNLVGTGLVGYGIRATRLIALSERARMLCEIRFNDNLMSIFILAIFCNILMYIAVDGFKGNKHELGKYLALFLCVAGFILAGFEHCIANMFYFSAANVWSVNAVIYLIVMTFGNAVGGLLIPASLKFIRK